MVGAAFDYLLRFEVQRRAPYAVGRKWVAETAAGMLFRDDGQLSVGLDVFRGAAPRDYLPPEEAAARARRIVQGARASVASFCCCKTPNTSMLEGVAAHAIRLAKLDTIVRARELDPRFETADKEDIEDLISMLSVIPFEELLHKDTLLLNPDFTNKRALCVRQSKE
jgi:hypothetical protein